MPRNRLTFCRIPDSFEAIGLTESLHAKFQVTRAGGVVEGSLLVDPLFLPEDEERLIEGLHAVLGGAGGNGGADDNKSDYDPSGSGDDAFGAAGGRGGLAGLMLGDGGSGGDGGEAQSVYGNATGGAGGAALGAFTGAGGAGGGADAAG